MKRYLTMIVLGILVFACSTGDNIDPLENGRLVTLNISMQPLVSTKRPVYSQEAIQQLSRVTLYVFNQVGADYMYYKTYNVPWTLGGTDGNFTLPDLLPAGSYRFLAVGREASDDYSLSAQVNTTNFNDFSASIDRAANQVENEIFSATQLVNIVSAGARVDMVLTRQVAGLLGYFKYIPKAVGGTMVKYLRLTMNASSSSVNLTSSAGNGGGTAYKIYEVDFSGQVANDSVYPGNTINGVVKLDFTQLNGAFLLPVTGISMTLGLYSSVGSVLKEWPIKNAGNTTFNIVANRFYSLGRKLQAASTDGGNPSNPSNNDMAIDLLHDLDIAITINPSWDVIYTLPIQDD